MESQHRDTDYNNPKVYYHHRGNMQPGRLADAGPVDSFQIHAGEYEESRRNHITLPKAVQESRYNSFIRLGTTTEQGLDKH